MTDDGWRLVVMAADCAQGDDGDLVCPVCGGDYADCPCPGPHQDDAYEYAEFSGLLWARRLTAVQLDLFAGLEAKIGDQRKGNGHASQTR